MPQTFAWLMPLFGALAFLFAFCTPLAAQQEDWDWVFDHNIHLEFESANRVRLNNIMTRIYTGTSYSSIGLKQFRDILYTRRLNQDSFLKDDIGDIFFEVVSFKKNFSMDTILLQSQRTLNGTIFLPIGNTVYLFTTCSDSTEKFGLYSYEKLLLVTTIEYDSTGIPRIIQRNERLLTNTHGRLAAVRHANGRDWWLVTGKEAGNIFHMLRIDAAGVQVLPPQVVGEPTTADDQWGNTGAVMVFNRSGDELAQCNQNSLEIEILDFDRCTGQLNNKRLLHQALKFYRSPSLVSSNQLGGMEYSYNNRYLYCAASERILRFDRQQPEQKPVFIDSLPYFAMEVLEGPMFISLKLGPDDVIYGNIVHRMRDSLPFMNSGEYSRSLLTIAPDGTYTRKGLYVGDVGRVGFVLPTTADFGLGPLVSAYAGPRMRRHVALCPGGADSASLGRWADPRNLTYQWAPAAGLSDPTSATPRAKPARTTTYTLTVRALPHVDTACGGNRSTHSDTITVHVQALPAGLSLGPNRTVCDSVVVLSAGLDSLPPSLRLRWSTGDTTGSIKVRESGEYSAQMLVGNCAFGDTVAIRFAQPPALRLPTDTTWCPNSGPMLLRPYAPTARSFRWSTGSTAPILSINTPGDYSLTIVDSLGCESSATVRVSARDSAQVALPADTTWCPSWGLLELRPDAPNARRFFWSTRELTPAILAADTGMYWVRVVDEAGCVGTDSIRLSCPPHGASIDLLPAAGDLFIPNAFSPNGDGLNETFQLLCARCVYLELSIYDRWGRLVFQSHDLKDAWDGRHMPEGVYAYRVRYRLAGEGNDREGRGVVSVVR
jgi:gliding motility-associated-like protein